MAVNPRPKRRASKQRVPTVGSDFMAADLGDPRRTARLVRLADTFSAAPDRSFPDMVRSEGELEAVYRFAGNENVDPEALLKAHAGATATRCDEFTEIVVPHDTSECEFTDQVPREGLGPLGGKRRGFLLHASIAVATSGGFPRPLGVLSAITRVRQERRQRSKAKRQDDEKESARWDEGVRMVRERLGENWSKAIHVMDREGDAYPLLAAMVGRGDRFVVRSAQDRVVLADGERLLLREAVASAEQQIEREVPLSKRGVGPTPYYRENFPARDRRTAHLCFSARQLVVKRPRNNPVASGPAEITLNVVHVWEPTPPEGAEPVEWFLLTTEPVDSKEAIVRAVDHYRARWVIEEFFKALKTGCAYESRQLHTYDALLVVLMIFMPIACRLLFMKSLARTKPDESAEIALTKTEIDVLREFSTRIKVGPSPTIREAVLAIAGLGGHLKRNGDPGWLTLARGMEKLLSLTEGWEAAIERAAVR